MKTGFIKFLKDMKAALPAALALILLFLPNRWFNPSGLLVLMPVFYFFIFNRKYMNFFVCLLFLTVLDYNQGSIFLWMFLFILCGVILSFQKIIILKEQKLSAALFFFIFITAGQTIHWAVLSYNSNLGLAAAALLFLKAMWGAVFTSFLYVPSSFLFAKVMDDR